MAAGKRQGAPLRLAVPLELERSPGRVRRRVILDSMEVPPEAVDVDDFKHSSSLLRRHFPQMRGARQFRSIGVSRLSRSIRRSGNRCGRLTHERGVTRWRPITAEMSNLFGDDERDAQSPVGVGASAGEVVANARQEQLVRSVGQARRVDGQTPVEVADA